MASFRIGRSTHVNVRISAKEKSQSQWLVFEALVSALRDIFILISLEFRV